MARSRPCSRGSRRGRPRRGAAATRRCGAAAADGGAGGVPRVQLAEPDLSVDAPVEPLGGAPARADARRDAARRGPAHRRGDPRVGRGLLGARAPDVHPMRRPRRAPRARAARVRPLPRRAGRATARGGGDRARGRAAPPRRRERGAQGADRVVAERAAPRQDAECLPTGCGGGAGWARGARAGGARKGEGGEGERGRRGGDRRRLQRRAHRRAGHDLARPPRRVLQQAARRAAAAGVEDGVRVEEGGAAACADGGDGVGGADEPRGPALLGARPRGARRHLRPAAPRLLGLRDGGLHRLFALHLGGPLGAVRDEAARVPLPDGPHAHRAAAQQGRRGRRRQGRARGRLRRGRRRRCRERRRRRRQPVGRPDDDAAGRAAGLGGARGGVALVVGDLAASATWLGVGASSSPCRRSDEHARRRRVPCSAAARRRAGRGGRRRSAHRADAPGRHAAVAATSAWPPVFNVLLRVPRPGPWRPGNVVGPRPRSGVRGEERLHGQQARGPPAVRTPLARRGGVAPPRLCGFVRVLGRRVDVVLRISAPAAR